MPKIDLSNVEPIDDDSWLWETLSLLNEGRIGGELNDKQRFNDKKHPLAHGSKDDDQWDVEHEGIIAHIHAAMSLNEYDAELLAKRLPNKDGSIGISPRRAREILRCPEIASAAQVRAMAHLFNCSIDFLQCVVREPEQRAEWGSPDEMKRLYLALSVDNRSIVWKVALGLLKLDNMLRYAAFILDSDPEGERPSAYPEL